MEKPTPESQAAAVSTSVPRRSFCLAAARRGLWKNFSYACALGMALTAPAFGFDKNDNISEEVRFGSCRILLELDATKRFAYVTLTGDLSTAGGFEFNYGLRIPGDPVTETSIAQCLSIDPVHITNLQQDGATESFESDTYIGFSFDSAVGIETEFFSLEAGSHEFKIGPGTFE